MERCVLAFMIQSGDPVRQVLHHEEYAHS
jgi:hypothetical protein